MSRSKPLTKAVPQASQWQVLCFYIPLAIQALSQSLTHPLVASIVSHGQYGAMELAAFSQGQTLRIVIGSINGGLITAGMVFGTSKTGMRNFQRLVTYIAIVTAIVQTLVCMPLIHPLIFENILGMKGELAAIARRATLFSVPLQLIFTIRNKYVVALFNEKRSGLANTATMMRIFVTAALSPLFVYLDLTGYVWGLIAMTIPVCGELYLTKHFARPFIFKLKDTEFDEKAPLAKQFRFTMPLSFGNVLLAVSSFMIAIFLSRTANPEQTLAIHYIVIGIISPLGAAAIRMQSVVIAFPPNVYGRRKIFAFACMAGATLCLGPLSLQIPFISNWYFGTVQNLPPESIRFARMMALLMTIQPLIQSLRGHIEGRAALRRRPNAILAGQAIYLATMVMTLSFFLNTKIVPSYMMGGLAILSALFMTLITIHAALIWSDFEDSYGAPSKRTPAVNIKED